MPRLSKSLLGLLALGLLGGCGGSDDANRNTGVGDGNTNVFTGSYSGSASTSGFTPYNFASATTVLTGNIDEDGNITGQVTDTNPASPFFNVPGQVSGKVNANGTANGTITFAGHNFITFTTSGSQRLTHGSQGTITGTVNATFNPTDPSQPDQNGTITFSLGPLILG